MLIFRLVSRAFGTNEFEGYDPVLYFIADYVDIDDSSTYTLSFWDRSGESSYLSETDVAANKSGSCCVSVYLDYQGNEYYE